MSSEFDFFHPDLQDVFDSVGDKLEKNDKLVPLEPHASDDPFYLAQLRQRELENLQDLKYASFEAKPSTVQVPAGTIMGQFAQIEVNKFIPAGLKSKRLAISTFMLIVIEAKSQKRTSYTDNEEFLVSGLFNEFDFDEHGRPRSLVVPLMQPRILKPYSLQGLEFDLVTVPVLNIQDWELDMTTN
jgi:hypothetical protein